MAHVHAVCGEQQSSDHGHDEACLVAMGTQASSRSQLLSSLLLTYHACPHKESVSLLQKNNIVSLSGLADDISWVASGKQSPWGDCLLPPSRRQQDHLRRQGTHFWVEGYTGMMAATKMTGSLHDAHMDTT